MNTRKLIAHGPSSLTVALPHKWVAKHHLQKGDSVHVEDDDQGLRIAILPSERKKEMTITVSHHDWPAILTLLTTIYRRGYDEITVHYETPEEYQHIATAVRTLLGYAVMENRKGTCIIKSLPTQLEQDFETLFRRVFLILLQQAEDLSDLDEKLIKNFYHRDADLNTIVNLALRMISKGHIPDRFEELHLFHALLILEECGDDMTRFTIEAAQEKDVAKCKEGVEKCTNMLRMLYDCYFQKKGTIMDFYKQYYVYWPDAKKMPAPMYDYFIKNKKTTFYLRSIVEKVIHLAEILLLPHITENSG